MSKEGKINCARRNLIIATAAVAGIGGVTAVIPFIASMLPSERAKATGGSVEVDVGNLAPGQLLTVAWRGQPVWIFNRSAEMLETLPKLDAAVADPKSAEKQQPAYCTNPTRSIKPKLLVVIGVCTHLGCTPSAKFKAGVVESMSADWLGGFLCPCHGSTFDFAGRVFKSKPASTNLEVPPHFYLSDTRILIGEDKKGA